MQRTPEENDHTTTRLQDFNTTELSEKGRLRGTVFVNPPVEIVEVLSAKHEAHLDRTHDTVLLFCRRGIFDEELKGIVSVLFLVFMDFSIRFGYPFGHRSGLQAFTYEIVRDPFAREWKSRNALTRF